jgi:hypothetical protein
MTRHIDPFLFWPKVKFKEWAMRFKRAVQTLASLVLAIPMAVFAHPGHVHHPGPVHGYSWIELLGFVALFAVPLAIALLSVRPRNGRDD